MTRLRDECGATLVFVTMFFTGLLGMTALVLDVGSWFREHRALQATADASALAGAQRLPDTTAARNLALSYATMNGGGVLAGDVQITTTVIPNDTIAVRAGRAAPGIFSRVVGVDSVDVAARARARSGIPVSVFNAAPIVVKKEQLACLPGCFDTVLQTLTLNNEATLSGGSFGLVDVARSGLVNTQALVSWIEKGFPGSMPAPEWYQSISSAKFNANSFESALKSMAGKKLLFPVYDAVRSTTNPPEYHVVGWVGFVIRSANDVKLTGNCSQVSQACYIRGYFTEFIAQGIMSDNPAAVDFGVRIVAMVG